MASATGKSGIDPSIYSGELKDAVVASGSEKIQLSPEPKEHSPSFITEAMKRGIGPENDVEVTVCPKEHRDFVPAYFENGTYAVSQHTNPDNLVSYSAQPIKNTPIEDALLAAKRADYVLFVSGTSEEKRYTLHTQKADTSGIDLVLNDVEKNKILKALGLVH